MVGCSRNHVGVPSKECSTVFWRLASLRVRVSVARRWPRFPAETERGHAREREHATADHAPRAPATAAESIRGTYDRRTAGRRTAADPAALDPKRGGQHDPHGGRIE